MTLSGVDFLHRFLQHVLPRGCTKVRYYGLWSPTCRSQLEHARTLLSPPPPAASLESAALPPPTPSASVPLPARCPPLSRGNPHPRRGPRSPAEPGAMTACVSPAVRSPARACAAGQGRSPSPRGGEHFSSRTLSPEVSLRRTTQALHHPAGTPQPCSPALPRALQAH